MSKSQAKMSTKVKSVNGHLLDPHCQYQSGTIYKDYTCTLNQTDVKSNKNKFYIMQIVQTSGKNILFIRYGRIGEPGRISHDQFSNVDGAVAKFEKQFKSKTKNFWANRSKFKQHAGKYFMSEIAYEELNQNDSEEAFKQTYPDSELDERVQDFIKLISDVNMMKNTMMELDLDTKKLPLGKISQSQIDAGYELLNDIKKLIQEGKDVSNLTSKFYTYIPYSCGRKKPPLIDSDKMIDKFTEVLDELQNIKIATNVIDNKQDDVNPVDAIYQELNTTIKPLKKGSKMWKVIEDYVHNTHAPTHSNYTAEVLDIYEIERAGKKKAYKKMAKKVGNPMLLWHGTRLTNYISILQKGLILRPDVIPGTYISGKMFGYGIYGASSFSKSFNYTGTSKRNDIGCMLLGEFALGEPSKRIKHDYYITKDSLAKEGCQSAWGQGKTTPSSCTEVRGVGGMMKVPNGKLHTSDVHNTALLYDEHIVYDQDQLMLRYIVKVRGKFKY